ncbi:MAG: tRNA (uracil-5-)-methyltransferase [Patescibacteria group bacterium]|nr:tRNA (uracil-5-)-methyltransferase [Patescibacteria group bacterium]
MDDSDINSVDLMNLTKEGYDLIAKDWSSTRQSFWPELTGKINDFILSNNYNNRIMLLDIGCGNGRLLSVADKENVSYLGVDVSINLLAIAKSTYKDKQFALIDPMLEGLNRIDDIYNSNADAKFDRIVSIAVLHHIPKEEVKGWLQNIWNAAEDDAHLLFTTWNMDQTYYELDEDGDAVIGFMNYKNVRYVHNYTYSEITEAFESVGFKILDIYDLKRSTNSGMSNTVILAKKPYKYEK